MVSVDPPASHRVSEIAEILAAGLIRMLARKSSRFLPTAEEISLDILGQLSAPGRKSPGEAEP